MPNLMQILSIFLKLQAVKQSGAGFFRPTLYMVRQHVDARYFSVSVRLSACPPSGAVLCLNGCYIVNFNILVDPSF